MIPEKLRSRRGMTLTEMLIALAIFALLTAALAVGTTAAWKVYRNAVVASEARALQSTLTQSLTNELRYAGNIKTEEATPGGETPGGETPVRKVSFDSETFGVKVSVISSEDGRIRIGTEEKMYDLLPEKAYTKGLKAAAAVSYAEEDGIFTVELTVKHDLFPDEGRKSTFTVRALNGEAGHSVP